MTKSKARTGRKYSLIGNDVFVESIYHRGIESALQKLAGEPSSSGSFQGKGQTLGGSSSSSNGNGANGVVDINPQLKVFLALIGVYLVLWYYSG